MYSVVLALEGTEELRKIDVAHQHVMSRVLRALQRQLPDAEFKGTCDLTWRNRKCSGNSLRVAREHLLYHGTLLYASDLSLIGRALKVAPRQPEYRRGRAHLDFVTNVPVQADLFAEDLGSMFQVSGQCDASSFTSRIASLREQRYDDPGWHFRH
jgi:lipoate-protein ligase A